MTAMRWRIPLCDMNMGAEESAAVERVLRSNWLTMGKEVLAFEEAFAAFTGAAHAVAVSNCTAALHLTLKALDVGPGDEVVVPSFNFCAGPNAVLALGARPVFADVVSADDPCVSPVDVAARITPATKAVMVMHYAGCPCDMEPLLAAAQRAGASVLEDAAHAPGAELGGRRLGTFGAAGCFSFFSNKNMTTGEGGMIVTDNARLAARLRHLRSHGMTAPTLDRHEGRAVGYDVVEPGFNYRLDEIRAAIGRVQLRKLPETNERRRTLSRRYVENLAGIRGLSIPPAHCRGLSSAHIQPIFVNNSEHRGPLMEHLKQCGFQSSVHYPPVHLFTWFRSHFPDTRLEVTEDLGARELTLPLYGAMSEADVDAVCDAVRCFFTQQGAQ